MDGETREHQEHRLRGLLEVIEKQAYELRENSLPGEFDVDYVEDTVEKIDADLEKIKDILYGNDDNEGLIGQ